LSSQAELETDVVPDVSQMVISEDHSLLFYLLHPNLFAVISKMMVSWPAIPPSPTVYVVLLAGHPSNHYLEKSSSDVPDVWQMEVLVMVKEHVIVSRAGKQRMS
jgi:hypothetical protein